MNTNGIFAEQKIGGTVYKDDTISGQINKQQILSGIVNKEQYQKGVIQREGTIQGTIQKQSTLSGVIKDNNSITGTIGYAEGQSEYPIYDGRYTVIPTKYEQSLETKNKIVKADIKIKEIPYYETSNISGTTVYIANEV